jgi:abortive infection bacteriophage resistance protein
MFNKPALTIDQQIDLLIKRGMRIANRNFAQQNLSHINYYRLRAYWLPFEIQPTTKEAHQFRPGTTFEQVIALYTFDRELRLLLLDAIERIEISLRAQWANVIATKYGPFAHEDISLFKDQNIWQTGYDELVKEYIRSKETFAEHFRTNYSNLKSPPIWASSEMMMLGQLSRWLQNLSLPRDRQLIADAYKIDEKILISFLHHLSIVRNHCAHHGRVWNRKFSLKMRLPHKPIHLNSSLNFKEDRRLYNTLTMLAYFFSHCNSDSDWIEQIKELIKNYPQINIVDMGFPHDWKLRPIWKSSSKTAVPSTTLPTPLSV